MLVQEPPGFLSFFCARRIDLSQKTAHCCGSRGSWRLATTNPLLGIGLSVLLLLLAGVAGLLAVRTYEAAIRQCRPLLLLFGWWVLIAATISVRGTVLSLSQVGRPGWQVATPFRACWVPRVC